MRERGPYRAALLFVRTGMTLPIGNVPASFRAAPFLYSDPQGERDEKNSLSDPARGSCDSDHGRGDRRSDIFGGSSRYPDPKWQRDLPPVR